MVAAAARRRRWSPPTCCTRGWLERMDLRVSEVVSDWGLRDSAALPVRLGRDPGRRARVTILVVLAGPGRLPRLAPAHAGSRWSGCSSPSACSPSSSTRSSTGPVARLPASRGLLLPRRRRVVPVRATSPTPCSCGASPAGRPWSTACRLRVQRTFWLLSVLGPVATGAGDGVAGLPLGHRRRGGRRPWACCCWAWFTHWTHSFCHAGYVPEQAGRPRSGFGGRRATRAVPLGVAVLLVGFPHARVRRGPRRTGGAPPDHRPWDDRDLRARRPGERMLAINDGGDRVAVTCSTPAARCWSPHRRRRPLRPRGPRGRRRRHRLAGRPGDNAPPGTVALIALARTVRRACTGSPIPTVPHDAEALLLAPDGTPYLVTRKCWGPAASTGRRPRWWMAATVAWRRSPR